MANLATTDRSLQALFEQHLGTIEEIINRRHWGDEGRQNALCWAWHYWCTWHACDPLQDPERAARGAALAACRTRRTFGRERYRGQADAMDAAYPVVNPNGLYDPASMTPDAPDRGWSVDELPSVNPEWAMVAKCLVNGLNRQQTAELIGVSTEWVRQRVDELAEWILRRQALARLRNRQWSDGQSGARWRAQLASHRAARQDC